MRKSGASFKGKDRATDRSAWAHAIDMQKRLTDDQLTDLGLAVRTSVERMRIGIAGDTDWHTLANAVNTSLVLCEYGYGADQIEAVKTGQDALLDIMDLRTRTGEWDFNGAGFVALCHAADLHEAQLSAAPRITLREALRQVRSRLDRGETLNQVPA